jgi:hypothetical protein
MGHYAEALATLRNSEKMNAANEGVHPADLAFQAMAQHHLGRGDEARATLVRLRQVLKNPRWDEDAEAEAQSFLREAEELIDPKVVTKPPGAQPSGGGK